jgi:hypothetical protein
MRPVSRFLSELLIFPDHAGRNEDGDNNGGNLSSAMPAGYCVHSASENRQGALNLKRRARLNGPYRRLNGAN